MEDSLNRVLIDDKINRAKDAISSWIAWRLPRHIVMWAAVRLIAHATQGKYGDTIVPELSAMEALKRWDK